MRFITVLVAGLSCAAAATAAAQTWPERPIRIVTPTTPGGPLDVMARLIGQRVQGKWGQGIVVEPRPGGAQNIAAEMVFRAPPDGYTLMLAAPTPYAINQHLFTRLAYEPAAFTPITILVVASNYVIVPAASPAKRFADLIAFAKANPGKLNYSSVGLGSTQHLTGEALKAAGNLDIVHVPYKGSSEQMVDLLGGRVDLAFINVVDAIPHIESGKLRALAVAAPQRSPRFPDMPAIAELFPGFQSQVWFALAAPPKTPADIVDKLNIAVREALQTDQAKKIIEDGHATAVLNTPTEAAAWIRAESERWGAVIRKNGIRIE